MNKLIDFLRQCPHFKTWTRGNLVKLSYYFKKKKYRRGNVIYRKDEPCKYVYIVFSGEFEQTKYMKIEREEDEYFDHGKYIFKGKDFLDNFEETKPKMWTKR